MARRADDTFDVLVIGGAAVGCAVARDTVGRGLTVALAEAGDIGGDFAGQLALAGLAPAHPADAEEAKILRRTCPHLTLDHGQPLPRWRILSRHFARRRSPRTINAQRYAILCARDAADRGARVFRRAPVVSVQRGASGWTADLAGRTVYARLIVDTTCGAPEGLSPQMGQLRTLTVSLLPADADTPGSAAFSLPAGDGLVAVGTDGPPPRGALWQSATLSIPARPNGAVTRDTTAAPLISLAPASAFHARRTAENSVAEMAPFVTMIGKTWTRFAALPGGDFQSLAAADMLKTLTAAAPDATPDRIARLFASYGTEAADILSQPQGQNFGHGMTEAELRWLRAREWATSAADVIWRRTALGPTVTTEEVRAIDRFLAA